MPRDNHTRYWGGARMGAPMINRKFIAILVAKLCVAATVELSATADALAQTSFPFIGGGTLSCGVSTWTVIGGTFNGATGTFSSSTGAFSGNFGSCTVSGFVGSSL